MKKAGEPFSKYPKWVGNMPLKIGDTVLIRIKRREDVYPPLATPPALSADERVRREFERVKNRYNQLKEKFE